MERPGVLIENGHVTHFTFAVVDVPKSQELGNDTHGSKVIVVPFDGASFDGGVQKLSGGARFSEKRAISLVAKGAGTAARIPFVIPADAASGEALFIALYNIKGRLVAHEYKGQASDKSQEISFDLDRSRVGSGVYCIALRYGNRDFYGRLNVQ